MRALRFVVTNSMLLLGLALGVARTSAAESTHALRMATVAPEGTAWAREFKALVREIEIATRDEVRPKIYLGAIAGDDLQSGQRLKRGQLDVVASAGVLCEQLAPSMRVLHLPGLYRNRGELNHVISRLKPTFDEEFAKSGYLDFGESILGVTVVFSRAPVKTMSDLKQLDGWWWSLDEVGIRTARGMGLRLVPLPLDEAGPAYENQRVNGFFAIPSAALAFQFSSAARFVLDMPINFHVGCAVARQASLDEIPIEHQRAIRSVFAKFAGRFTEVGKQQDDALMRGLFARQGLVRLAASSDLQSDFLVAARNARDQLDGNVIPQGLVRRVLEILLPYRASHFGDATAE